MFRCLIALAVAVWVAPAAAATGAATDAVELTDYHDFHMDLSATGARPCVVLPTSLQHGDDCPGLDLAKLTECFSAQMKYRELSASDAAQFGGKLSARLSYRLGFIVGLFLVGGVIAGGIILVRSIARSLRAAV